MMKFEDAYEELVGFRIRGFADKCVEIADDPACDGLSFLEKVALAAEYQSQLRKDKRIAKHRKEAQFLDPAACLEKIIYLPNRTLHKDTVDRLGSCNYIRDGRNIIVTSKTGSGKSYFVQALGDTACRRDYSVRYTRHADMCRSLNVIRAIPEYNKFLQDLEDVDLLILDDFFLEESDILCATDLLEILTHREARKASVIVASQLSPEEWHLRIRTKIIADALLDRIVHNSYTVEIDGPNMREHLFKAPSK